MAGETSRANGRRSRGPRSVSGKAQSRRNALRHGLAALTLRTCAPTPRTMALALELAEPYAAHPPVLQAALDVALAEEVLASVCRERQRVLHREREKAERLAALCDGLEASLSLLPALQAGASCGEGPGRESQDLEGHEAAKTLLAEMARSSLLPPDLPPALQAWATGASELLRLERYHRRAFGRRERAHAQLHKALEAADRGEAGPADPGLLARVRRVASEAGGEAGSAPGQASPRRRTCP